MKLIVLFQTIASLQAFLAVPSRPSGLVVSLFPRSRPLFASEAIQEIEEDAKDRMAKSIDSVKTNLSTVRTGRANSAMLDRVKVTYYGVETPLNQMASVSVGSAQQLTVQPYDRSQMGEVEKSILEADLGLTPTNDGTTIRINIPPLTQDRRKDMLKLCKGIGEDGKVAIRNIRRDGVDNIKKLEKSGDVGEDEMKDGLDAMQKLTDTYIKEIDGIVSAKEKEVSKV
jgi:ribosome recycling factor